MMNLQDNNTRHGGGIVADDTNNVRNTLTSYNI